MRKRCIAWLISLALSLIVSMFFVYTLYSILLRDTAVSRVPNERDLDSASSSLDKFIGLKRLSRIGGLRMA